jgi:exodeoxyribonuclease III
VKIFSWNVNGIRSCIGKGFYDWLSRSKAEIVGVQEVRASVHQIPSENQPRGWRTHFHPAQRPGYSGVGLYSRKPSDEILASMGKDIFDVEGRFQWARFGKLHVVNTYIPNGTGPNRDLSRIPYKLDFSKRLFHLLEKEKSAGARILVMGDFNTAHEEIDIARPRENKENSGFRPEERAEVDRWIKAGWVDSFRIFNRDGGHYSWWSNRLGARERNVGWRIDYIFVSPTLLPFVRKAAIHPDVMGSDHCPISVVLDRGALS